MSHSSRPTPGRSGFRFPWQLWALVALFFLRGYFYCRMLPLWEGWDEYAHFAFLQHWNLERTLPDFGDPISREIDESLRLAALPKELDWMGPPYLTHSQWWALPAAERADRSRRLASLSPALAKLPALRPQVFYEAQQSPLYYWLAAPVLSLAGDRPIADRVFLVRILSLMLASFTIPLTWLIAREILPGRLALFCPALVAAAPGFAIATARIANDTLAIPLAALLVWLVLRRGTHWTLVGAVLGCCLLAKAYLLPLIPALLIWWALRRDWRTAARVLALALSVGGWWYVRNLVLGRTFSGWLEHATVPALAAAVFQVDWVDALSVVTKSFIWFGGWSFLTLKSWMYTVIELASLAGFALAVRRRHGLVLPVLTVGWFSAALGYGVLVDETVHKLGNVPGWYLWAVAPLLAVILTAGLRRWTAAFVTVLAAWDLYGAAALLVPYYSGLVERNRADGGAFFHGLARLGVSPAPGCLWIAATLAVPAVCLTLCRREARPEV